jgi:enterochelin esterase-like enzyme
VRRALALFAVALALGCWGLWQIDMVRQTVRISYLSLTGGLWRLHGRTVTLMAPSAALGQKRQVIVYLPKEYDLPANSGRRYPVLYLLHGFPDPGNGWVRFGLAPRLVDKSIVQGALPPLLIVMADAHGTIGQFGDGEYLNAPTGVGKPGTRLADFVTSDLPAWTDAHFRTIAAPAGRLLAGSSTGAYAALNLGFKRPDVFGTMLSFSGYFEADLKHFGRALWTAPPDAARLRAESPLEFLATPNPAWRRQFVYLGNGLSDYPGISPQNDRMELRLQADGVPYVRHRLPGHHSWDLWRLLLIDGLESVRPRLIAATAGSAGAKP